MKLRVAKRILANKDVLKSNQQPMNYAEHQIKKAETITKRTERRLAKLVK